MSHWEANWRRVGSRIQVTSSSHSELNWETSPSHAKLYEEKNQSGEGTVSSPITEWVGCYLVFCKGTIKTSVVNWAIGILKDATNLGYCGSSFHSPAYQDLESLERRILIRNCLDQVGLWPWFLVDVGRSTPKAGNTILWFWMLGCIRVEKTSWAWNMYAFIFLCSWLRMWFCYRELC